MAAAVIIALAIFVPALTHGPGPAASHSAAGPLSTRSGLSMRAATPGALARPDHGGAVANPSPAPVSSTTPDANGAGNANGPAGNARAANSNGPTANSQRPDGQCQCSDAHYPVGPFGPTDDFGPANGLGPTNQTWGRRKRRLPPLPRRSTASARPRGQRRVANGSRCGGQT